MRDKTRIIKRVIAVVLMILFVPMIAAITCLLLGKASELGPTILVGFMADGVIVIVVGFILLITWLVEDL